MPQFRVTIQWQTPQSHVFPVKVQSQNAVHAAAAGLSLAGGGCADLIEVQALRPAPGKPAVTVFEQCTQGLYGFAFVRRLSCNSSVQQGGDA